VTVETQKIKFEAVDPGFTQAPTRLGPPSRVAVIGGGINGVMSAWALMDRGYHVELYECDEPMAQTSSASTKMLHGGLRYLAQGRLKLVKEALHERRWWLSHGTPHTAPLALVVPIPNRRWLRALWVGLGVKLYDLLARGSGFQLSRWLDRRSLGVEFPGLDAQKFIGGWLYWDAAMDDRRLGEWALDRLVQRGLTVKHEKVIRVTKDGDLQTTKSQQSYTAVVNTSGPWAQALLQSSNIPSRYGLELIRGSHIVCNRSWPCGLAIPHVDGRLIFMLPWKGKLLIGTTESQQTKAEKVEASTEEIEELLSAANQVLTAPLTRKDVLSTFSGLRPVVVKNKGHTKEHVLSEQAMSSASRESTVESVGRIITLWGGKWTTSRQQGLAVAKAVSELPH
jgi:glycerol-3-phosphate dehydrogenase